MSVHSRNKGVRGEREVAKVFTDAGLEVRGLEGLGDHLIVAAGNVTLHSEVKRQERVRIPEWIAQAVSEAPAGTIPTVIFRQNRGRWYATIPLENLVTLIGGRR